MPPKPDSLDQRSPVIVLFASDFPVYPEPYTYLGTIRMNQKWRRCEVEPLAFLQGKARRVGPMWFILNIRKTFTMQNKMCRCAIIYLLIS